MLPQLPWLSLEQPQPLQALLPQPLWLSLEQLQPLQALLPQLPWLSLERPQLPLASLQSVVLLWPSHLSRPLAAPKPFLDGMFAFKPSAPTKSSLLDVFCNETLSYFFCLNPHSTQRNKRAQCTHAVLAPDSSFSLTRP